MVVLVVVVMLLVVVVATVAPKTMYLDKIHNSNRIRIITAACQTASQGRWIISVVATPKWDSFPRQSPAGKKKKECASQPWKEPGSLTK